MNSHLHAAWQINFLHGIEVSEPFPEYTTEMNAPTSQLAKSLAFCPENPIPSSCPSGVSGCDCCIIGTISMKVASSEQYRNFTGTFAIWTIPHPRTLATLTGGKERVNVSWVRQEAPRNPWLEAISKGLLCSKVSSNSRVTNFKQAVVDRYKTKYALWLTAEADIPSDLEWQVGFRIPKALGETHMASVTKSEEKHKQGNVEVDDAARSERADASGIDTRLKRPQPQPRPEDMSNVKEPTPHERQTRERALLEYAKKVVVFKRSTVETRLRASLEAWSLADMEAWMFARGFLARRSQERTEWEKEEANYTGVSGSEKGRGCLNRWKDSRRRK